MKLTAFYPVFLGFLPARPGFYTPTNWQPETWQLLENNWKLAAGSSQLKSPTR
jgi:hypothetical protein